jgi:hypothetical protein
MTLPRKQPKMHCDRAGVINADTRVLPVASNVSAISTLAAFSGADSVRDSMETNLRPIERSTCFRGLFLRCLCANSRGTDPRNELEACVQLP